MDGILLCSIATALVTTFIPLLFIITAQNLLFFGSLVDYEASKKVFLVKNKKKRI